MSWVTVKRIFKAGMLDFWRNGFVSLASVLMMTFTLFTIGAAIFTGVILSTTLTEFRNKADINVYFVTDAPEDKILSLKSSIEARPEVASVNYLSREQALAAFRDRYQNDQLILQSLDELGQNPLGAVLTVKAKDIAQYGAIATFLQNQQNAAQASPSIIDKITYFDDRQRMAIDRIASITDSAKWIGLVIIIIFIASSIAISYNTLRMAIYTSRDEISVMRLVGAARGYIRFPFVVEGMLYGLISGVLTLLLFYPLTWWMGTRTETFFGGVNIFSYYMAHFPLFFISIVGSGVCIGAIASFLAVRKYLTV